MDDNAVQGLSHPLHRQCGFASTSDLIYRVNLACHSRKHPQYLFALWSRREVSVPHGRSRLRSESILVPHRYCLSCFFSSLFTSSNSYSVILILSTSTFSSFLLVLLLFLCNDYDSQLKNIFHLISNLIRFFDESSILSFASVVIHILFLCDEDVILMCHDRENYLQHERKNLEMTHQGPKGRRKTEYYFLFRIKY